MSETRSLLGQLSHCILKGKVNRESPYPQELKNQDGASEITQQLLEEGVDPRMVLQEGLMSGMQKIGISFEKGEAFIPELLIAAQAMMAAMAHLKPYFQSGEIEYRGKVILGTVAGDLHDIGKNIVRMVLEGDGWEVIDLGVDVTTEQFLETLAGHPGGIVGLSALLTTTMVNMEGTVKAIREQHPDTLIFVGGAPLTVEFADRIGAHAYFPEPSSFTRYLAELNT